MKLSNLVIFKKRDLFIIVIVLSAIAFAIITTEGEEEADPPAQTKSQP